MPIFQGYFNNDEEQVTELDFGGLIGTVLDPIGLFRGGGIGGSQGLVPGLLGMGQPPPPPLPPAPPPAGSGVGTGTVTTPAGPATVQLVEPAASLDQLRDLQAVVQRDENRINSISRDMVALRDRFAALLEEFARDAGQAHRETRSESRSSEMMGMMVPFLMQRRQQRQLATHTHAGNEQVPDGSNAQPAPLSDSDDTFLLLLPLLMGEAGGGRNGNDPMMMVMMMMMMSERGSS